MLKEFSLKTETEGMYNITSKIVELIRENNVQNGLVVIFCPHTTAGITINENADSDVQTDLLLGLAKAFLDRSEFLHYEGNSAAHLKSTCVGVNQTIIVSAGRLLLGTWQGIYFCEFDGPRQRRFYAKLIKE